MVFLKAGEERVTHDERDHYGNSWRNYLDSGAADLLISSRIATKSVFIL